MRHISMIFKAGLAWLGLAALLTVCEAAGGALSTNLANDIRIFASKLQPWTSLESVRDSRPGPKASVDDFSAYLLAATSKKERGPGDILIQRPVSGRTSSLFGSRRLPSERKARQHRGLDIAAPKGTPIVAAGEGRVVFAGWRGAYGRVVEIDHGEGLTTLYAHMDKYTVEIDQKVYPGSPLGAVGNTGRSTGPHLHFEVRADNKPLDPLDFVSWTA